MARAHNVVLAFLAAATVSGIGPVHAQSAWPSKAVRFVVPFAPGGQSDVVARMVAEKLAVTWAQPVVVENKAGAATTIGADLVEIGRENV